MRRRRTDDALRLAAATMRTRADAAVRCGGHDSGGWKFDSDPDFYGSITFIRRCASSVLTSSMWVASVHW
jgi:general stress protein YciG